MNIVDILLGRPLASQDKEGRTNQTAEGYSQLWSGCARCGGLWPRSRSDSVDSVGHGPCCLGLAHYDRRRYPAWQPLFSDRQTIAAYPQRGGSYTVATKNLGEGLPLPLTASALLWCCSFSLKVLPLPPQSPRDSERITASAGSDMPPQSPERAGHTRRVRR